MTGSVYWPTVLADVPLITMLIVSHGRLGFVIRSNSLQSRCPSLISHSWPCCRGVWVQGSVNVRGARWGQLLPTYGTCANAITLRLVEKQTQHTSRAKGKLQVVTQVYMRNARVLSICPPWPDLLSKSVRRWEIITTKLAAKHRNVPRRSFKNKFPGFIKCSPEISH